MKSIIIFSILLFVSIGLFAQGESINNLSFTQRTDGSGMVDIYYDLSGSQNSYTISLEISFDGGATYQNTTTTSGDIRSCIAPGNAKHIILNAMADFPNAFSNNVKFRLTGSQFNCGTSTLPDAWGNDYTTVLIGNQCWMAENLNSGVQITSYMGSNHSATGGHQSDNDIIEKHCYDNDSANCNSYGALYCWNEMMQYDTTEGIQGICPNGWHVPSDNEWKILEGTVDSLYGIGDPEWDLGGVRGYNAHVNLKSTDSWSNANNGVDLFGFTAKPGGCRNVIYAQFLHEGDHAHFWTSSQISTMA
ncbi:MAG: FISUMP domain-containing protein, partial [Bacteroidota bacterium]|nr:FISUMP domain-containing protein [Bacteroidota bacterium]